MQRIPEIHSLLKVEPELGLRLGETSETDGRVGSDGASPVDDLIHPWVRDAEASRGFLLRHPDGIEKVLEEHASRPNRAAILGKSSSHEKSSGVGVSLSSVVVDDLNIQRGAVIPAEADSVLVVDSDRMLTGTISTQRFETKSGKRAEGTEGNGRVEAVEDLASFLVKLDGESSACGLGRSAIEDVLGSTSPEGSNHSVQLEG